MPPALETRSASARQAVALAAAIRMVHVHGMAGRLRRDGGPAGPRSGPEPWLPEIEVAGHGGKQE